MSSTEAETECRRRILSPAILLPVLFVLLAAMVGGLVLRTFREDAGTGAAGQFSGEQIRTAPEGAAHPAGWSSISSTVDQDCIIVISDRATVRSAEGRVLLWYEGAPEEADLILTSCGVNSGKNHTIYLNGSPLAQAKDDSYRTCDCKGQSLPVKYHLSDPAAVINGWNHISITNDADVMDTWMVYDLQLVIRGDLTEATIEEFTFTSSYDGSLRRAVYQLPIGHDSAASAPLLVSIGGTLEDRWDALARFAHRANARDWFLLAPDVRQVQADTAGRTASLGTQHDIIDAIHYMQAHFNIDGDRIYMSGFSTGGGVAATVAAKYPDVFAAVVAWKAPTALLQWIEQRPELLWSLTTYDIGCSPQSEDTACLFEWQRRSARELCMNLKHVPMAIVHGRADTRVPFAQSADLYDRMSTLYDPGRYSKLAIWHDGGHVDWLPTFEGLDFVASYTLSRNPRDIMIRTDESKDYYWIRISQQAWNDNTVEGFSTVMASYDWTSQAISVSVWDERSMAGRSLPLEIRLDLQTMGFEPRVEYTIEDHHPASGTLTIWREVLPADGQLIFTVPRERAGQTQHQYAIYPSNPTRQDGTPEGAP